MKNITQGAKKQTNRKEAGKKKYPGKKGKVLKHQNKDIKEQYYRRCKLLKTTGHSSDTNSIAQQVYFQTNSPQSILESI